MTSGWHWKTLGDVCAFDKVQGIHSGLPYVGLEHIESHTGRFIGSQDPQTAKSATFRFSTDHVLYGRLRPYLNKAFAPDFDGHCSTEIFPIKPGPQVSREFLLYWLLSDETGSLIDSTCTGARMPRADMNAVLGFKFPVPPLPEQKRIVRVLDEAFEAIAVAKANAEKNLQNARVLFDSRQQALLAARDISWKEKPLATLCSLFVDSAHRTPKYQEDGIPALRPRDIVNGELSLTTAARVSMDEYEIQSKRHRPGGGDIVYSRELSFGWAAKLPEEPKICLSQGMCLFRPGPELDPGYLLVVLNGPIGREQAIAAAVGAAHPHINLSDIKEYRIPLPPLSTQKAIVQELLRLKEHTERLASLHTEKLATLDELKKSLLHQAFTGKL